MARCHAASGAGWIEPPKHVRAVEDAHKRDWFWRVVSALMLVAVACVGNVAGSTINWAMGRSIEKLRERRWFPIKPRALARAEQWYRRFGRWTLLLSWTPVIGDPLTMIAGVLREPLWSFLLIVAIAKTARYVVIAALLTM